MLVGRNVKRYPMVDFHLSMLAAVPAGPPVPIEHQDAEFAPPLPVGDRASPPAHPDKPQRPHTGTLWLTAQRTTSQNKSRANIIPSGVVEAFFD